MMDFVLKMMDFRKALLPQLVGGTLSASNATQITSASPTPMQQCARCV